MRKAVTVFYLDKTNKEMEAEFNPFEWIFIRELIYRPYKFYY